MRNKEDARTQATPWPAGKGSCTVKARPLARRAAQASTAATRMGTTPAAGNSYSSSEWEIHRFEKRILHDLSKKNDLMFAMIAKLTMISLHKECNVHGKKCNT